MARAGLTPNDGVGVEAGAGAGAGAGTSEEADFSGKGGRKEMGVSDGNFDTWGISKA